MTVCKESKKRIVSEGKKIALLVAVAIVCGLIGALFSACTSWVTALRRENGWLILLMPIVGVLSVSVDRLLHTQGLDTDRVLRSARGEVPLSPLVAPAAFVGAVCSHLGGASVGREGAALQLGGGIASFFARRLGLSPKEQALLIRCGMAGVFSAVFGTPLAAAVFALEVPAVGNYSWKLAPLVASSLLSHVTARLVGGEAEMFLLTGIPSFRFSVLLTTLLIAVAATLLSTLFSLALHGVKKKIQLWIPNDFVRIIVGGAVLIVFTTVVGTQRYNGAGIDVIASVFSKGEVYPWDFALKLLFTVIAVSSGYKGGEIIPSLFIGATFGGLAADLLGLPSAFGAAIGLTTLFCGVTNCPLASLFLAAELFSWQGIPYMILAVLIGFFLSGKVGLYSAQQVNGFKTIF